MPRIMPEPRYFSMPSSVVGAVAFRKAALNCRPWVRSLTQDPEALTNSPAEISAAWPTTVTGSRWPRSLTRRTQKPVSALWKVTRSTSPARASVGGTDALFVASMPGRSFRGVSVAPAPYGSCAVVRPTPAAAHTIALHLGVAPGWRVWTAAGPPGHASAPLAGA